MLDVLNRDFSLKDPSGFNPAMDNLLKARVDDRESVPGFGKNLFEKSLFEKSLNEALGNSSDEKYKPESSRVKEDAGRVVDGAEKVEITVDADMAEDKMPESQSDKPQADHVDNRKSNSKNDDVKTPHDENITVNVAGDTASKITEPNEHSKKNEIKIEIKLSTKEAKSKLKELIAGHADGRMSSADFIKMLAGGAAGNGDAAAINNILKNSENLSIKIKDVKNDKKGSEVALKTGKEKPALKPAEMTPDRMSAKEIVLPEIKAEQKTAKTENNDAGRAAKVEPKNDKRAAEKDTVSLSDLKTESKENLNNLNAKGKVEGDFQAVLKNETGVPSKESAKLFESNRSEIIEQINRSAKIMVSANETKFSTIMRPEELGRVDFKFSVKDGKVNGRIILQSQEAADFFRSNVEEMRAVFQKANVELDKLEVSVAGKPFSQNAMDFAGGNGKNKDAENNNELFTNKILKIFDDNSVAESNMSGTVYQQSGLNIVV